MVQQKKQNVLILGTDGYVGRELLSALQASGDFTPVSIGATDRGLDAAMQHAHAVANCVTGNERTILAAATAISQAVRAQSDPPRVLHLSTMSVYGSMTGVVDESAPLPRDLSSHPAAEAAAEKMLSACPRVVIFRPARVFGPGSEQATLRIARLLTAHRLGDLGAAGDGYCNLVHIGDVVQALMRALGQPGIDGAVFNLGLPNPPTWNEFLVKFGVALGATPVRRITPRRLRLEQKLLAPPLKMLELAARAAGMDPRRLPGPMPASFMRTLRQEIVLDTRRAQTQLALRWRDLASMLEEAAAAISLRRTA